MSDRLKEVYILYYENLPQVFIYFRLLTYYWAITLQAILQVQVMLAPCDQL